MQILIGKIAIKFPPYNCKKKKEEEEVPNKNTTVF